MGIPDRFKCLYTLALVSTDSLNKSVNNNVIFGKAKFNGSLIYDINYLFFLIKILG